jgi:hypothetical protein
MTTRSPHADTLRPFSLIALDVSHRDAKGIHACPPVYWLKCAGTSTGAGLGRWEGAGLVDGWGAARTGREVQARYAGRVTGSGGGSRSGNPRRPGSPPASVKTSLFLPSMGIREAQRGNVRAPPGRLEPSPVNRSPGITNSTVSIPGGGTFSERMENSLYVAT